MGITTDTVKPDDEQPTSEFAEVQPPDVVDPASNKRDKAELNSPYSPRRGQDGAAEESMADNESKTAVWDEKGAINRYDRDEAVRANKESEETKKAEEDPNYLPPQEPPANEPSKTN